MPPIVSRVATRLRRSELALKYGLRQRREVVDLALELAGDLDQVVADVAQVRARAELEALEPEDRLARGLELVALGGDEPVELVHALLEPVAAAQVLAPRAVRAPRPRARRRAPRSRAITG